MTLQEIRNQVAKDFGYKSFEQCYDMNNVFFVKQFLEEVCRRAQLECATETLKEASEKAELIHCGNKMKEAITNEANIKLIQ